MTLHSQRRQHSEAEQALQQALGVCRLSADSALQPLRRHWPVLLVGGGALAGWMLERRRARAVAPGPNVLLGRALGLLPLLLRWNAVLAAPTSGAADAAVTPDGSAADAAADQNQGEANSMGSGQRGKHPGGTNVPPAGVAT